MKPPVYIVGVSARTPLGLEAESSAAAVRAGLSALDEHPFLVDQAGDMMPAAVDPEIDPYVFGSERLLQLSRPVLENLLESVDLSRIQQRSLRLFVGLPEVRPGFTETEAEEVRTGLTASGRLKVSVESVSTVEQGHASVCSSIASAVQELQRDPTSVVVVGGVESYFNPWTMEWFDGRRSLANSVSRSGFVPGEGAAFLLLAGETAARALDLTPIASIAGVGTAGESKLADGPEPCLGEGLTKAIRGAVEDVEPTHERISDIFCDINSERYRGEEWGFVCLRLPEYFVDPTSYVSPADSWGDMGAASVPLFAMLACIAASKGYATGSSVLLWASSPGGLRGAVHLKMLSEGGYV